MSTAYAPLELWQSLIQFSTLFEQNPHFLKTVGGRQSRHRERGREPAESPLRQGLVSGALI